MTDRKSNRGGSRPNAGRKPGAVNKATKAAREMAEATGVTPLEFMLNRMRDEQAPMADRMDMAKAAAPFIHAKLSSVEASLTGDLKLSSPKIIEFVSPEADAGAD